MIMHSYGSDEAPEKFVLVESLPESEGIQQLITTESLNGAFSHT